jgi:hypothetical protein
MGTNEHTEPLQAVHWTQLLDARELDQVRHAMAYADDYASAGVPGHSQFMLIAKLVRLLGASLPGHGQVNANA